MKCQVLVAVATLLAVSLAGSALPTLLAGQIRDSTGAPLQDAVVFLHQAGRGAYAAGGTFQLAPPDGDDVLVVHRDGYEDELLAVNESSAFANVTLRAQALATSERFAANGSLVPLPALLNTTDPVTGVFRIPFDVRPGVLGVEVKLDAVSSTVPSPTHGLGVEVRNLDTGARYEVGNITPMTFHPPGGWLRAQPGKYEIAARPDDALQSPVNISGSVTLTYASGPLKNVQEKAPEVSDAVGDFQRGNVVIVQESQDIVGVAVRNETPESFEIVLLLSKLASLDPSPLTVASWTVFWTSASVTYFASFQYETVPTPHPGAAGPEAFIVGSCDAVAGACERRATIPGRLDPGMPGQITFYVPKDNAGSPADRGNLTNLWAATYRSNLDGAVWPGPNTTLITDTTTQPGPSYTIGASQFALAPGVADGLRRAATGPAPTLDRPGAGLPATWLLVAGLAVVALGGVAAWLLLRRRRSAPAASRYEILSVLGEGANGRTFLARHRALGKLVAVKEVHPAKGGDATASHLLAREARIAGSLRHPQVVDVYDIEETSSGLRIVMEYVEGGSLEDRLRKGLVPRAEALRLWAELLEGLSALHARGIVHRDIKPSNLLLTQEGSLKVADFGVARTANEGTVATQGAVGTPMYMTPEQWSGTPPTPASDVFSASAVAARMLLGHPLDRGGHPTPWGATEPGRLSAALATLPAEERALLERGLALRAEDRPDARTLAAAVREVLRRLGPASPAGSSPSERTQVGNR